MSQQIALFTLTEIAAPANFPYGDYDITITAAGETTQVTTTILPGVPVPLAEHLKGMEPPPEGTMLLPVSVSLSGGDPNAPNNGGASTTFTVPLQPSVQPYSLVVPVSTQMGSILVPIRFEVRYREYPVSYDPEWLCRNRYNYSNFYRWLCLSTTQVPSFNLLAEVTALQSTLVEHLPRLQRVAVALGASPAPAGTSLLERSAYVSDIVMAATALTAVPTWAHRYVIEDFLAPYEERIEDVVLVSYPVIDPQLMEMCKRWRELLDCFCKFCARKPTMPVDAVQYFDTQVVPDINALFPQMQVIAIGEGMPAWISPAPNVDCEKLRYIVSFWAWWCRVCGAPRLFDPVWAVSIEPWYTSLYNKRAFLDDLLSAQSIKLCKPPEKDFCKRWLDLLDCLKKLCDLWDDLPGAMREDLYGYFITELRNAYTFLKLQPPVAQLDQGVGQLCQLVNKLRGYFTTLCNASMSPWSHLRRTQLDTLLVTLEGRMTLLKSMYGDVCADEVPMTECAEWDTILDCLEHLCAFRHTLGEPMRTDVIDALSMSIDQINDALPEPFVENGESPLDAMCAKISAIRAAITEFCANGVDPLLRVRLYLQLQLLQTKMLVLGVQYPDLCSTSTTIPSGWCDEWLPKLRCLKRYCDRRAILTQDVVDDFVDSVGDIVDKLDWLLNDRAAEYEAPAAGQSMAALCAKLAAVLDAMRRICNAGTIDPLLKKALDALLEEFQDAFDAFNTLHNELCNNVDTLCEGWVEILDCVMAHHDRWLSNPENTHYTAIVNTINDGVGTYVEQTYVAMTQDPTLPGLQPGIPRWAYIHRSLLEWFAMHCSCCDSISESTRAYLQSQFDLVENAYVDLPFCGTSCTTSQLALTTGSAPWAVTLVDNVDVNPPGSVNVLDPQLIAQPRIGASQWISPHPSPSDSVVGWTEFRRCFCLCRAADVRVRFTFFADDYADIYVDDQLVYAAVSQHMGAPESCDVTVYLTAGEHCVRARVRNDPEFYMYLGGDGSITSATRSLMTDACCNDEAPVSDPCAVPVADCSKLAMLPRLYRALCCVAIDGQDPILQTAEITTILSGLTCVERLLPRLQFELGIAPGTFPTGGALCERLRPVLMTAMFTYSGKRRISPYVKRTLDCFIDRLCQSVKTLRPQLAEKPLQCAAACDDCDRWFELFTCICALCRFRRPAGPGDPGAMLEIDAVLADDLTTVYGVLAASATQPLAGLVPMAPSGQPPVDICEMLRRSTVFLGAVCMYAVPIQPAQRATLETAFVQLRSEFDRLRATLGTTFSFNCPDACPSWRWRLECLYRVALRRAELPANLAASFDTLFASRITGLFNTISPAPAGAGAPASSLASSTLYKLLQVLRALDRYCGPCNTMPTAMASLLASSLNAFIADYTTFGTELANAGISYCDQATDACARLDRLPETASVLCGAAPPAGAPSVVALEDLFTRMGVEIASIANVLRLPATTPPGGPFCNRMEFVVCLLASAWARYHELPAGLRAAVEYLDAQVAAQAAAYGATIPGSLPRPETPAWSYAGAWRELLRCVCNACSLVAGMSVAERASAADLVAYVEATSGGLADALGTVYGVVLSHGGLLRLPIVDDPCATTLCRRARIIASFFACYAMGRQATDAGLVGALELPFEAFRTAVVLLRSKLFAIGRNVCGEENEQQYTLQSQALYLQAAGSTGFGQGGDGSAAGVHLRWALLGELGKRHLPKGANNRPGSPYYATFGYNKPDDDVTIYRARYVDTDSSRYFPARIDLTATTTRRPSRVSVSGGVAEWVYENVPVDTMFTSATTTVTLRFTETASYRTMRADNVTPTDPRNSSADVAYIIGAYSGTLEAETFPKAMFAIEVIAANQAALATKVEAISLNEDPAAGAQAFISARKEFQGAAARHKVLSEAVQYFRLRYSGSVPATILVETYADFYTATRRRYLWAKVGAYGLSLDTPTVAERLEEPARYVVDGAWPKYGTEGQGGAARVNVDNYLDRWVPNRHFLPDGSPDPAYDPGRPDFGRHPDQSLRAAVETYLQLSTDPDKIEAWVEKGSTHTGDSSLMNISVLRMLLLAAQDYHVARMLGLGMIDPDVPLAGDPAAQRYVYMAEYTTPTQAGAVPTPQMTHRYLSLPTGRTDWRLPVTPAISGFTFGLHPDFTDAEGYTKYGDARFVKVNRGAAPIDLAVGEFFDGVERFSRGTDTRPVQFGIKVTKLNYAGPRSWRLMHPVNDHGDFEADGYKPYVDNVGNPEIHGIPDVGNPVFVHMVENVAENHGEHRYSIYGINWFSRASTESICAQIVDNTFPTRNTLLPPTNLSAQYIQKEVPPVLTSVNEQNRLAEIEKRTRVLFDWNHVHNIAYQAADRVRFFFRTDPPTAIRGRIKNVVPVSGSGDMMVETESYPDLTADPAGGAVNIVPAISPAQVAARIFEGSVFTAAGRQFAVVEATADAGGMARFRLAKLERTDENGNSIAERWAPPPTGSLFMVAENLANASRWTALPQSTIMLADFTRAPYPVAPPHAEEFVEEGQRRRQVVGGLFEAGATIEAVHGPDDPAGVFKITCQTMRLFAYNVQFPSNPWYVEFYRGTARVPDIDRPGRMTVVPVVKFLENAQGKLEIYVYDPKNAIGPQSGSATIDVNFHPSYRAYINLHADGIPESDVLPAGGAPSRQTFVAAWAIDGTQPAQPFASSLTPPAVHTARRIVEALKPNDLIGPRFATRPDFYGKSSCSLDAPISAGHSPYGMVFYRGDEETLLRALYRQQTIDAMRPALDLMPRNDDYYAMWAGLVHVETEDAGAFAGHFKSYNSFRFPLPDNPEAVLPNPAQVGTFRQAFVPSRLPGAPATGGLPSAADDIREVIAGALVPLTERPVLMAAVTADDTLQTSSARPVVRDMHGNLLAYGQPGFDPYPMVRRRATGDDVVRFTDYTVDGASTNVFFYCAREVSNTLAAGPASKILGPVRTVNTAPSIAPVVRHVVCEPPIPGYGSRPEVAITIAPYRASEGIKAIRLYRATSYADAVSTRSMTSVGEFALAELEQTAEGLKVRDTFAGITPPYGQPIFYRLVGVRPVPYEHLGAMHEERVESMPSEIVLANVVDSASPAAPPIDAAYTEYHDPGQNNAVTEYRNVVLTWHANTQSADYALYKMAANGDWKQVAVVAAANVTQTMTHSVGTLVKLAGGSAVYHRYKVVVTNSYGLRSTHDVVLTL